MSMIHTTRNVLFGVVLGFSVIVLALSAFFISFTDPNGEGIVLDFTALGIVLPILTAAPIVAVIIIERIRKDAFLTKLCIELGWVGVLWLLWLVEGALAARNEPSTSLCGFLEGEAKSVCSSWPVITAFSFLNWIMLMGWFIALLVFGIRGNHWMSPVADTDLSSTRPGQPSYEKGNELYNPNAQYPPQQQQQFQQQQQYAAQPPQAAPYSPYQTSPQAGYNAQQGPHVVNV